MKKKPAQLLEAQKAWIIEENPKPELQELPADVLSELYSEYNSDGPCNYRKAEFKWLVGRIHQAVKIKEESFDTDLDFKAEWDKFLLPILRADIRPLNKQQLKHKSVVEILRLAPMNSLTKEREPFAIKWVQEKHHIPFALRTNKWKSRVQVEGINSMQMTIYLLIIDPMLGSNVFLPAAIQQAQAAYEELLTKFEALEKPLSWPDSYNGMWYTKPTPP